MVKNLFLIVKHSVHAIVIAVISIVRFIKELKNEAAK